MAITSFQQDPNGPPGAGYFADEFGNKRYAFDPVTAQGLAMGGVPGGAGVSPTPAPQSAMRMGSTTVEHPEGGQQAGAPATVSDVQPSYGSPQQQAAQQAAAQPGTVPQNENQAITGALQNNIAKALTAPQGGGVKPGFYPSSRSETVTDIKRPITQEEEQGYESAEGQKAIATANTAKLERDKQLGVANSAMASLPRQYAQMEVAQKKRDDVAGLVQQNRSDLDQFSQELQQNQKSFNANRLFDDKLGTAGSIGAALFRAIGTYAQVKGHMAENPAGQIIDAAIQRDIAEQRMKIDDSKGNVDNALNRLRLHFGDLDLAEKALANIQHNYAETQTQFYAAATGSQQVIENARASLADQQTAAQKRMTDFMDRATGVATKKIDEKYNAGGTGAPNLKQQIENYKGFAEANKILSDTGKAKADPVDEAMNMAERNIQRAKRIKELINKPATGGGYLPTPLDPKERGELEGLQSQLQLELPSVFSHSKRVNDSEIHMMTRLVGDPDALIKSDVTGGKTARIDTVIQQMEEERKFLKKHGARADGTAAEGVAPYEE